MAENLALCPRCNRLFTKLRVPVCFTCQEAEEADYEKIREVLDYEPTLNAEQAAHEAEVGVEVVLRMLNQGLIVNAALAEPPKCGRCGAPAISVTKRLCHRCVSKLDADFTHAVQRVRSSRIAKSVHETFEEKRRD